MTESIQILATVAGLLLVCAVSIWAIWMGIVFGTESIAGYFRAKHKEPVLLWKAPSDISQMGRWLSWYFPITEDIEKYLIECMEGNAPRIEEFREQLFRKYGKRETTPVGPAPDPKEPESRPE